MMMKMWKSVEYESMIPYWRNEMLEGNMLIEMGNLNHGCKETDARMNTENLRQSTIDATEKSKEKNSHFAM